MIFSHSFVIIQDKTSPICPDINMYTYRYDYILLVSLLWQKKKSDKSKLIIKQFGGVVQHGENFLIAGG